MSKFYPLTVAHVKHETRDAIAVTFDVPPPLRDAFKYRQGQHLTLRAAIDGEDVRRSYSICAAVQDDTLRVAIKRVPGGLFELERLLAGMPHAWSGGSARATHTFPSGPDATDAMLTFLLGK